MTTFEDIDFSDFSDLIFKVNSIFIEVKTTLQKKFAIFEEELKRNFLFVALIFWTTMTF